MDVTSFLLPLIPLLVAAALIYVYLTRHGYLTKLGWKGWGQSGESPYLGVVKLDWVPTGRIDFAVPQAGSSPDMEQPSEFRLLVEERRIVESIAGNQNLEIQWRLATLKEAKVVIAQYHKYLTENSLIKSVAMTDDVRLVAAPPLSHDNPANEIERAPTTPGNGAGAITSSPASVS